MKTTAYVKVGTKYYPYSLRANNDKEKTVLVFCEAAGMNQEFLAEDITALIDDLPEIIESVQAHMKQEKAATLQLRISPLDRKKIEDRARASGKTVSAYVRERALA